MSKSSVDIQSFYPSDLKILSIDETDQEIIIHMHSISQECTCYKCGSHLIKHHGSHHRNVQDLPILGKRVKLDTQIFDYECINPSCAVSSVTETFDGFLSYNSRMTERLEDFICILAVETSCEACSRILKDINVKISGDTVIRLLTKRYKNQPIPDCSSTVGIDDFAFKKRHNYGTIIVDEATHEPVAVLDGRDGESLKEWLRQNQHVTTVTRDRASAYAKAVEEVLPDCMQIADRFHLHQNLLDAVNKVLGRTIPATTAIPCKSDSAESEEISTFTLDEGKKIASIVDNFIESERKRRQLIIQIQSLHNSGTSIREIAHITGKERKTVKKYLEGDPDILCRSNKRSALSSCDNSIIKRIREGMTASAIAKQLQSEGYLYTISNIRHYITTVAEQHGLNLSKYSSTCAKYVPDGKKQSEVDYVTRKGIFNHLWMNIKLTTDHREYLWDRYNDLFELELCIREFREIFNKKSMPYLYLFIERYKISPIKEIASFTNGLEKDINAIENAVASPLSNGYVEGTNSKVKTIKKAMYGRCGKLLLSAKLMYKPMAKY